MTTPPGLLVSVTVTSLFVTSVVTPSVAVLTSSCTPTELVATSVCNSITYNDSQDDLCSWIIRGSSDSDIIVMRVTDWFTPSGFSCSRDRLVIRDGPDIGSPYLRVLCGAPCDILDDATEVMTSSNAARVIYLSYGVTSSRPRGFTLVYRSLNMAPLRHKAAMYTNVNYALMCISVFLIGGLVLGLAFLYIRELGLTRQKKRQQTRDVLKRRRAAFSGESGLPSAAGSGASSQHTSPHQPPSLLPPSTPGHLVHPTHCNNNDKRGQEEGKQKGGDEEEEEEEEQEQGTGSGERRGERVTDLDSPAAGRGGEGGGEGGDGTPLKNGRVATSRALDGIREEVTSRDWDATRDSREAGAETVTSYLILEGSDRQRDADLMAWTAVDA